MTIDDAQRADELAQSEDLDVLWNAFYSACEADLSELGWPGNSLVLFKSGTEEIESAMAKLK